MPETNKLAINTETKLLKIKIDSELNTNLTQTADREGEKGYLIRSSFILGDTYLCLIFQRTR